MEEQKEFELPCHNAEHWSNITSQLAHPCNTLEDLIKLILAFQSANETKEKDEGSAEDEGLTLGSFEGFFDEYYPSGSEKRQVFLDTTLPSIITLALALPSLFPDGSLPTLGPLRYSKLSFLTPNHTPNTSTTLLLTIPPCFPFFGAISGSHSRSDVKLCTEQVGCLLVHMLLCTLRKMSWTKYWTDFSEWLAGSSRRGGPIVAYLSALFDYFDSLPSRTQGNDNHPHTHPSHHAQHRVERGDSGVCKEKGGG